MSREKADRYKEEIKNLKFDIESQEFNRDYLLADQETWGWSESAKRELESRDQKIKDTRQVLKAYEEGRLKIIREGKA